MSPANSKWEKTFKRAREGNCHSDVLPVKTLELFNLLQRFHYRSSDAVIELVGSFEGKKEKV